MAEPRTAVATRALTVLVLSISVGLGSGARAQPALPTPATPTSSATPEAPRENPAQLRYWTDGGAIPFVYGSLLATLGVTLLLEPPATPRLFPADEGGGEPRGDTVPSATVGAFAGVGLLTVALADTEARWYHLKGFGEAAATTYFLTAAAKHTFGRHRPDFDLDDPASNPRDARLSFFSGHSSMTVVTTTYLALYAHGHLFPRWRGSGGVAWWELAAYAGLGAITVGVPASRVIDRRHHLTDVATGSIVGAASAFAFYTWQERRFRGTAGEREIALLPHPGGFIVSARF